MICWTWISSSPCSTYSIGSQHVTISALLPLCCADLCLNLVQSHDSLRSGSATRVSRHRYPSSLERSTARSALPPHRLLQQSQIQEFGLRRHFLPGDLQKASCARFDPRTAGQSPVLLPSRLSQLPAALMKAQVLPGVERCALPQYCWPQYLS